MDPLTNKLIITDRWLPVVYLILIMSVFIACLLAEKDRVWNVRRECGTTCSYCVQQPASHRTRNR